MGSANPSNQLFSLIFRSDSECFPVSIGVCTCFLSRRAFRNCIKVLEETLLDGVANVSAIVARVIV